MKLLRPAPITAAAVLLLFVGGEALVVAVVSAGLAWWWVTPDDVRTFLSFLGMALLAGYVAADFIRSGIKTLRGTFDSFDKTQESVRWVTRAVAFAALGTSVLAVLMLWRPSPTRPKLNEIAAMAGALMGWANTAALLTAGRLLRKNSDGYLAWRISLAEPPPDAEGSDE